MSDVIRSQVRVSPRKGMRSSSTAWRLIRRAAGLSGRSSPSAIGDALDRFVGTMTAEEAEAIDRAVEEMFERVDEEKWR